MFLKSALLPALQDFIGKEEFYGKGHPPIMAAHVVKCALITKQYGGSENEWDDGWNPSLSKEYERAGFSEMIQVGDSRYIAHIILEGIWEKFLKEEVFLL